MLAAVPWSQLPPTPHSTAVTGAQISFFAPVTSPAMAGTESDSRALNANENMDTFIVCSFK